jgi:hypothetical protein
LLAKDPKLPGARRCRCFARALCKPSARRGGARLEEVYRNFPTSPEADTASGALRNLQGEPVRFLPARSTNAKRAPSC